MLALILALQVGLTLTFRDNSDNENGFGVYRCSGAGCTPTKLLDLPANMTTYADTGLSIATMYCYTIDAFNDYGRSLETIPPVCATTTQLPAAASNLKVE